MSRDGWPLGEGAWWRQGMGTALPGLTEQGAHVHSVGWVTMLTHDLQVGETDPCGSEVVEIRSTGGTPEERGERQRERQGCSTWASGGASTR